MSLFLCNFYQDISNNIIKINDIDYKNNDSISNIVTNFINNSSMNEDNNTFSHFVHSIKHNEPIISLIINNRIHLFNYEEFYIYIKNKLNSYKQLDETELEIVNNLPDNFKYKIIKLFNQTLTNIKKIVI